MPLMLSEAQQRRVWESWLGAETRAYYFADLAGHYQQRHRLAQWATVVVSSSAVATLLQRAPAAVSLTLAVLTAGLSAWSLVHNPARASTECGDLHFRWSTLALGFEALWQDMYAADSAATLAALRVKEAEISKSSVTLPYDAVRMRKWEDHVVDQHGGWATA